MMQTFAKCSNSEVSGFIRLICSFIMNLAFIMTLVYSFVKKIASVIRVIVLESEADQS